MTRLPIPERESLDAGGQRAWDSIVGSRGRVVGPFQMLMHHPIVAERVAALGEVLRFQSSLKGDDRELAILAAGREVGALYEWAAHEPLGLKEGTRPEAIDVLRHNKPTTGLTPREALIIDTARALYHEHTLSDDHYARAESELGRQGLIELVTLVGYYGMIGFVLNTFDVDLPAGVAPPFVR